MSTEKKIVDIMVSPDNYTAVTAGAGFREIVGALKKSLTSGGPDTILVYDNNLLAGFIGFGEVLNAIEAQFLKGGTYRGWTVNKEWAIPVFWEGLFTDRCIEATGKKAGEIMKPVQFAVETGDPLIKAVYGMTKHSTGNLPVLRDGLVAGIVRSKELFLEVSILAGSAGAPVFTLDRMQAAGGKTAANSSG
ncbi:MAG: CBS domain-containing protein [Bacillota bacterium]